MARSQLSRHPCRSTHSAEPPLGLPKGRQIKNQINSQVKNKITSQITRQITRQITSQITRQITRQIKNSLAIMLALTKAAIEREAVAKRNTSARQVLPRLCRRSQPSFLVSGYSVGIVSLSLNHTPLLA